MTLTFTQPSGGFMNNLQRCIASILPAFAIAALGIASAEARTVERNLNFPGHLSLDVTSSCDNSGSVVTLGPTITLQNVPVTILFDGGGAHDQSQDDSVDFTIDLGGTITLPKSPHLAGVTGNPKISVYVNGVLIVGPIRCNKL